MVNTIYNSRRQIGRVMDQIHTSISQYLANANVDPAKTNEIAQRLGNCECSRLRSWIIQY